MKRLSWVLALALACGGDDDGRTTPTPGVDSGTPTPGVDSGTPMTGDRDPRLQTNPAAGQVSCGTMTCNVPSQTCCTTLFPQGQTCHTCTPPMGMGGVVGLCNAGDSCPGGYTTL